MDKIQVRIKTPDGKPVNYESEGACGFDLRAIQDYTFAPGEWKLVDTGVVVEIPEGYALHLMARSSTFRKHGLMMVNSVGLIDNDYCGDEDFLGFQYINMSDKEQKIEAGTRIGQGVFVKVGYADFEVVDKMGNKNRGGIGSTGVK